MLLSLYSHSLYILAIIIIHPQASMMMKTIIPALNFCISICFGNPLIATFTEFMIWSLINIAEFFSFVSMLFFTSYFIKQEQQEEGQGEDQLVALIKHNINQNKNIPWLNLPADGPPSLFNLSQQAGGAFYNLSLSKQIKQRGQGYICGSSKGCLAIITTPITDYYPQLFLWNPLSDQTKNPTIQLPSLTTIPSFIGDILRIPYKYNASKFIDKIEISSNISSSDPNQVVVAMLCNAKTTLAYCTPGDKRWTFYKHINRRATCEDILFSNNILYTLSLIRCKDQHAEAEGVTSSTITCLGNTSNEFQAVIKSIKHAPKYGDSHYEANRGGFVMAKEFKSSFCLVESVQGELLMIRRDHDMFMQEEDVGKPEFPSMFSNYPPAFKYGRTSSFQVYKFNPATSYSSSSAVFDKLTSLEDQALFYSEYGSVAVPARDFGQGNCIYFIALPYNSVYDHDPKVSREAGVFYLEDGTIKRHLPSFKLPAKSHPCWFMPNLDAVS